MVYLAELLAIKADRLKIITICARNVHCVHGQKRLDDDASLASLLLQESNSVVYWMRRGAVLLTCNTNKRSK